MLCDQQDRNKSSFGWYTDACTLIRPSIECEVVAAMAKERSAKRFANAS